MRSRKQVPGHSQPSICTSGLGKAFPQFRLELPWRLAKKVSPKIATEISLLTLGIRLDFISFHFCMSLSPLSLLQAPASCHIPGCRFQSSRSTHIEKLSLVSLMSESCCGVETKTVLKNR